MNESFMRSWWILALRGVIAIAFGVLALMWPNLTLLALVALFAAYALLGGAVMIIGAVQNRKRTDDWWIPLLLGLFGVGAGIIAVGHPALSTSDAPCAPGGLESSTGALDDQLALHLG